MNKTHTQASRIRFFTLFLSARNVAYIMERKTYYNIALSFKVGQVLLPAMSHFESHCDVKSENDA